MAGFKQRQLVPDSAEPSIITLAYDAENAPDEGEPDASPNEANPAEVVTEPYGNEDLAVKRPARRRPPPAEPTAAAAGSEPVRRVGDVVGASAVEPDPRK